MIKFLLLLLCTITLCKQITTSTTTVLSQEQQVKPIQLYDDTEQTVMIHTQPLMFMFKVAPDHLGLFELHSTNNITKITMRLKGGNLPSKKIYSIKTSTTEEEHTVSVQVPGKYFSDMIWFVRVELEDNEDEKASFTIRADNVRNYKFNRAMFIGSLLVPALTIVVFIFATLVIGLMRLYISMCMSDKQYETIQ